MLAEVERFIQWAAEFAALGVLAEEGDGAEFEFVAFNLGVGGNGELAAAAHAFEEGAFGKNALQGVIVVEPGANFGQARIVLANFNANSGLADAGEHFFEGYFSH